MRVKFMERYSYVPQSLLLPTKLTHTSVIAAVRALSPENSSVAVLRFDRDNEYILFRYQYDSLYMVGVRISLSLS